MDGLLQATIGRERASQMSLPESQIAVRSEYGWAVNLS